jgi:hypothetical protein
MRVSLDSNVWEVIFRSAASECLAIRNALATKQIEGFICEATFRIEAVRKSERLIYFAQPKMSVDCPGTMVTIGGKPHIHLFSIGPDDKQHPGLPAAQTNSLRLALAAGIRLMRAIAWMGLPAPPELRDPNIFTAETEDERKEREQRQLEGYARITALGVGKAAFDAAGGWGAPPSKRPSDKAFQKACAEWADGELVGAHIGYRNDVLCTNDQARATGSSVFDPDNRARLAREFGVQFLTTAQLAELLG